MALLLERKAFFLYSSSYSGRAADYPTDRNIRHWFLSSSSLWYFFRSAEVCTRMLATQRSQSRCIQENDR
jgi:hypothetical protein